jgi:tetratricopeptide (TPR) repeat protein
MIPMVPVLLFAALSLAPAPRPAVSPGPRAADLPAQAAEARRKGDLAAARRLYEEALRQDPQNGPVALALSETLLDMGDSRAAEELLARLVRSLPERPEPRRALARAYLQNRKTSEALAEARRALDLDPENPESHIVLAAALKAAGRPAEGITEIEKAAKESPRDARVLHELAMAYASLEDPRTEGAFDHAIAAAPGHLDVRFDFVKYLWQAGNFDRGNQEMERLLAAAPPVFRLKLRTAYAASLMEQQRFTQAARELERIWKDGARDYEVVLFLGASLGQIGRFDEAVRRLREAIAIAPEKLPAHHILGRILLLQQKPEEAIVELERAAALQPDSAGIQLDLGSAYEAAKRPDKAEAAYREALRLDETLTRAHYSLGTLLARTGRREEAAQHIAVYKAAFQKEQEAAFRGGSRRAELNLGWVALRTGQPERALAQFDRHPDDPDALKGAARALVQLGRDPEAFQRYERALALAPDDAALRYELGREYDRARRE